MENVDPTTSEHAPAAPVSAKCETVRLPGDRELNILRFGAVGARPKVYLQAGLHADELPGMLVLRCLGELLAKAAEVGGVLGEIVLVPAANPIGLTQCKWETMLGRFDLETGENFNRGFADLAAGVGDSLDGVLGDDAERNVARVRKAMLESLQQQEPAGGLEALRVALLTHACVADIVLDLHADNEAQLHMYTTPELWPEASDLAAEIDARAVLLAEDSGGGPFDEACSRPWRLLAERFPEANLPPACLAATLELRSNNDLDFEDAWRDARALYRFLQRRKVVAGDPGRLPRLLCRATDLTAMQQVKAPQAGLVVYHARLGDRVQKGEIVAEIVPPVGESVLIEARTDGILFARHNERWAWEGRIIGKIAGEEALPERQEGDLLSP